MGELKFRELTADEIECRVSTVKANGISLLLYKDARCDMNILDETVGPMNWQRSHSRDNANCIVSIWDEEKKMWISKEDTGTESNTEAAKGLASDSFKRACFNWGIGRELYTAPFIWVSSGNYEVMDNGKTPKDTFKVKSITIKDKKIVALEIINEKTGAVVYSKGKGGTTKPKSAPKAEPKAEVKAEQAPGEQNSEEDKKKLQDLQVKFVNYCKEHGIDYKKYGLKMDSSYDEFDNAYSLAQAEVQAAMPFPID